METRKKAVFAAIAISLTMVVSGLGGIFTASAQEVGLTGTVQCNNGLQFVTWSGTTEDVPEGVTATVTIRTDDVLPVGSAISGLPIEGLEGNQPFLFTQIVTDGSATSASAAVDIAYSNETTNIVTGQIDLPGDCVATDCPIGQIGTPPDCHVPVVNFSSVCDAQFNWVITNTGEAELLLSLSTNPQAEPILVIPGGNFTAPDEAGVIYMIPSLEEMTRPDGCEPKGPTSPPVAPPPPAVVTPPAPAPEAIVATPQFTG